MRKYISPIGKEGLYVLDTGSWRTYRPVMEKENCIECGSCMAFCPVNSIYRDEEKKYHISYDYCKGCGICAKECPKNTIIMKLEGGGDNE